LLPAGRTPGCGNVDKDGFFRSLGGSKCFGVERLSRPGDK